MPLHKLNYSALKCLFVVTGKPLPSETAARASVAQLAIGFVTTIGANRNWQCQLPTQIGNNQTANLKVAVVTFHNFLCAIIQA